MNPEGGRAFAATLAKSIVHYTDPERERKDARLRAHEEFAQKYGTIEGAAVCRVCLVPYFGWQARSCQWKHRGKFTICVNDVTCGRPWCTPIVVPKCHRCENIACGAICYVCDKYVCTGCTPAECPCTRLSCIDHSDGGNCFKCYAKAIYESKRLVAHHEHRGRRVQCADCDAAVDGLNKDAYVEREVERERKRIKE